MPYHRPIPDPDSRGKRSGALQAWVQAEKFIQIVLVLPSAAFIGWVGGLWLDHTFHKTWITPVGLVVGIFAGLAGAIRMAVFYAAKSESSDEGGDGAGDGSGKEQ